ncbi:MAG: S8 family serine peptidase [Lachnospiraceae bacterium]|nr:S8 family serine peptidase [Lachnospiraceae bacterium]
MKKILVLLIFILVCYAGSTTGVKEAGVQSEITQPSDDKIQQDIATQADRVVIALLDTGVAKAAITSDHLLSGYNYVTNSDETEDMMNHGTAVASVILGCESAGVKAAAQDAYIVPLVVVTKQDGEAVSVSPEILAKAVRDSVDIYGADIINISLGIEKDEPSLFQAIVYAEEKGVLVVSAVGNGGAKGNPYYPAAYDTVLAVGSCDENGQESEFSQSGSDVLAMGEDIWLASKNGKTYGARGTSYATGFVSAVAADFLIKEPDLSLQELREKIIEKAAAFNGCK